MAATIAQMVFTKLKKNWKRKSKNISEKIDNGGNNCPDHPSQAWEGQEENLPNREMHVSAMPHLHLLAIPPAHYFAWLWRLSSCPPKRKEKRCCKILSQVRPPTIWLPLWPCSAQQILGKVKKNNIKSQHFRGQKKSVKPYLIHLIVHWKKSGTVGQERVGEGSGGGETRDWGSTQVNKWNMRQPIKFWLRKKLAAKLRLKCKNAPKKDSNLCEKECQMTW